MKYFLVFCLNCLTIPIAFAQDTIKVRLLGERQWPIENATITLGNGIVVNADSRGELSLSAGDNNSIRLSISHLGYIDLDTTLAAPFDSVYTLQMKGRLHVLDEVEVSTGYQSIPKERATGSFETIDNNLFNRQITTDVISRLDGIVPSVLFDHRQGEDQRFNIRGLSTLTTARNVSAPLVILDNFPYEGDINNINPNDIAHLSFLKDAAATSIWGARAGNGVIVITTKKGSYRAPLLITVNANVTVSDKPDLFYSPQMGVSDFIDIELDLFGRGVYSANLGNNRTWPVVTPVVEILASVTEGELSHQDAQKQINNLRLQDVRDDYTKYVYQNAVNQQYALSLRGGTAVANYLLSAGLDKNIANLKANGFNRVNLRSHLAIKPAEIMELQFGMYFNQSKSIRNNPGKINMSATRELYPYARLVDGKGNPAVVERDYRTVYLDTVGEGRLRDWYYKPLEEIQLANNISRLNDFLLNAGFNLKIADFLHADLKYQYEQQVTQEDNIRDKESYFVRNLINRFTQISDGSIRHVIPVGGILDKSSSSLVSHSLRTQLNIDHQWQAHSDISGIIGGEVRSNAVRHDETRYYGYDKELMTSQPVDYINRYPIYDGLAANSLIPSVDGFLGSDSRFVSLYTNMSYRYRGKYILSGSARRDASNLFGVDINNKWKPLWSIGVKWHLDRERFYRLQAINKLAISLTYGHSGNVNNTIPAVTTMTYSSSLSPLARLPFGTVQNPPNSQLRWENVRQFNVRVDFATMAGRLSGSLEYYDKNSHDLIGAVDADMTSGFMILNTNSASLSTRGADMTIRSKNIAGRFAWYTNMFLSYNENKVKEYHYKDANVSSFVSSENRITPIIGYPAYSVFSYEWAGLDPESGDPLGFLDGELSGNYNALTRPESIRDLIFHGSAVPKLFGGIRNDFSYKGVSLSINLTYRLGYFTRRSSIHYSSLLNANTAVGHADFSKRWKQPGDERFTNVPSMVYPADSRRDNFYARSSVLVERGDHIRLQDVNISYQMPNRRWGDLRLTLYARHLGILWKASGINLDPDFQLMKPQRTVALGVSSTF